LTHKYHAQALEVDGILFPSIKQAERYQELKLLEKSGLIRNLRIEQLHKKELTFTLQEGFRDATGKKWRAIKYVGDFRYIENGQDVVEDAKGYKTKEFRIKEKMFRYRYPEIVFKVE